MRCLLYLSYDGSKYNGYAKQKGKKTVQGKIEEALKKRFNKEIRTVGSGRTDKGVHAYNQCIHFDISEPVELNKLKFYLNTSLNREIYIYKIEEVEPSFHARYSVKMKQYLYKINIGTYNPIEKDYVYQYCKKLNIKKLKQINKLLKGTHDFKTFTPEKNIKDNYIRTIYDIKIKKDKNYVYIYITASGFLRYMVRNIIGLYIGINEEKIKIEEVQKILKSGKRSNLGVTAPSEGLYLNKVFY